MVLDRFSLTGQVGIVTGGGQGLGKVFCHAFAEAGAASWSPNSTQRPAL